MKQTDTRVLGQDARPISQAKDKIRGRCRGRRPIHVWYFKRLGLFVVVVVVFLGKCWVVRRKGSGPRRRCEYLGQDRKRVAEIGKGRTGRGVFTGINIFGIVIKAKGLYKCVCILQIQISSMGLVSSNLLKLGQHFGVTLLERWIREGDNGLLDQCNGLLGLLCCGLVADSNVHQI